MRYGFLTARWELRPWSLCTELCIVLAETGESRELLIASVIDARGSRRFLSTTSLICRTDRQSSFWGRPGLGLFSRWPRSAKFRKILLTVVGSRSMIEAISGVEWPSEARLQTSSRTAGVVYCVPEFRGMMDL